MPNTKNIYVNAKCPPTNIPLGRQGENRATCVTFDCTGLVQLYGDGTAELLHELKSGTVYPVAIQQDGASVSWTVSASDTATVGAGRAELRWYVGDTLAKSAKFRTSVSSALADSTTEAPPEPQQSWVDTVLQAVQEIKDGAILDEKLAAAIAAYLEEHPIDAGLDEAELAAYLVENGYLKNTDLADAIAQALAEAKASGEFDGVPGADGKDGAPGKDGISATHSWNGTVLTITSASGTSSADLKGDKGDKGEPGEQGIPGTAGSDANVTAENIQSALGYTPANSADLANKLTAPSTAAVGQIFQVKSINEDGSLALEAVDMPSYENLGAWEDIVTVTIEESVSVFTVDKDANGNPFSLSQIICELIIPEEISSKTRSVYFALEPHPNKALSRVQVISATTVKCGVLTYARVVGGRVICNSGIGVNIPNRYQIGTNESIFNGYGSLEAELFDSISVFTYNDAFPAGCKFIIRGIRK